MRWLPVHVMGGVLVAAQTAGGGFKDVLVLTNIEGKWAKVSLLDGFASVLESQEAMADWLNQHSFVPIVKTVTKEYSVMTPPENRLGLPQVQIISMKNKP